MTDRLLVDLSDDGRVSVSTWIDGDLPGSAVAEPFELVWPLDEDALEDLRWYLEDYLRAPYGVYEERGAQVDGKLAGWGEAIFRSVFGAGPARDAYVKMRARKEGTEVVFRSSAPSMLGLPWELMRDPDRPTPLALDLSGMSRSLPTAGLPDTFAAAGESLRVLMVICRPAGTADVGYRMVARPLLERLDAVRGHVDLVVLRPPTLDELRRVLSQALAEGRPFQVVHFDGHGVLPGRGRAVAGSGAPLTFAQSDVEGLLAFEKAGGGSDHVKASVLAQVLKDGRVPVVVLNACQSGAVGRDLEAAVATRLLQEGVGSVVAMAYSVYAVAAAEFIAAFYERLFAGDRVTEAVSAGRRRLHQANLRPSPKGLMALTDWLVPVHYLRRDVHFPLARTPRTGDVSLEETLDRLRKQGGGGEGGTGDLESVGTFVGRDALFYELEVAARIQRVVVLYGPGGTGKTELAKAFGRWWRDTGGVDRPEWVIVHSFEPGVASFGLDGVVSAIGRRLFGVDFARLDVAEQRDAVERELRERRLLLIWDNFETVVTMPDPTSATPPLDDTARGELRDFLAVLAAPGGNSAVVVTSRNEETWLGDVRRIPVGGLTDEEANEYADELLASFPAAAPRRAKRTFADLMQWLDGHPLSMRLVLPHLNTTEPDALLAALQGLSEIPGLGGDGHRTASLTASVSYSFRHLPPIARRLLVAVCLFQSVADANVLGVFAAVPEVPERFRGHDRQAWAGALDAAADVGLLTRLGGGMYRIHPALPVYLATQWRGEEPDHDDQRAAAARALLTAHAVFGWWLSAEIREGDAGLAYAIIDLQRRTLGHILGYALDNALWAEAQALAQPLDDYWDVRGLYDEARGWVDRIRFAVEDPDGTPPPLDISGGALWLFAVGCEANRQERGGMLDQAEDTYTAILDALRASPPSRKQQRHLAGTYHQLSLVARHRGRLDDAESWCRKSLEIMEELGNRRGMAFSYHQLGIVAQLRERLDDAESWCRESHQIMEELGDRPGMAITYHQLGIVAQLRERLDDAEGWYRRSLQIKEELGDRPGMAITYHQLGMVTQLRERLDDAEGWYRRSLQIEEELGDRPGMAISYHQLGTIAQLRERFDDAEGWCRRSLQIREELGDRPGMAMSYGQLGLLAGSRGSPVQALEWVIRCVSLFEQFPHPATSPGRSHLALLVAELGMDVLEGCWLRVTGSPLPEGVRQYVAKSGTDD